MEISGFRIERLIAEGGMASVYLAVQESLGRHVALKLLKKFDRPEDSERFLNEGRTIAALNHPNIITIHDIGFDGGRPFIAMEYLEGGSLTQRIERGMMPEAAVDIVIAIGGCLDFVHRQGMIHRDVKPANILFHSNGTPKLTDFGIAKSMEVDSDLTLDGSAVGSPYYLSPEQAQNKPLDGRADVYSLGIIFYEMLSGKKPFRADSHIETILSHVTDELPPLPPELALYEDALELMTAKDPDDRFSSAGEMLGYFRALRGFAGAGVGAGHNTASAYAVGGRVAEKGREWLRDSRLALAVGATLSLVLLGWVAGGWFGPPESESRMSLPASMPKPADPEPKLHPPVSASQIRPPEAQGFEPEASLVQLQSPPEVFEPPTAAPGAGVEPSAAIGLELEPQATEPSLPPMAGIESAAPGPAEGDGAVPLADSIPPVDDGSQMGDGSGTDEPATAILPSELADIEPEAEVAPEEEVASEAGGQTGEPDVPQLLELAAQAVAEYRLTIPPEDSALYYFEQVLQLETGQPEAEQGLDRIADRYADLGRREIEKQAFSKAELYLRRGLLVRPDYPPLLEAQGELNARRLELAAAEAARERVVEAPEPQVPEPPAPAGGLQSIFQH